MQGLLSVPLSGFWTHSHWAPRGHKPAQPDPCDKHLPPFLSPVTSDTRSRAGLGPRNKGWAAGKQQPEVQRFHITLVYDLFYLTTHQRENKMTSTLGLREGPEQEFPKNAYYSLYRIFVTHMQRPKFSGYKMASFRWWATTINVCVFFFFLRLPRTHASVDRHMGSVLQVFDPPLGTASDARDMLSWCSVGRGRRRSQGRKETVHPTLFPNELLAAWEKSV